MKEAELIDDSLDKMRLIIKTLDEATKDALIERIDTAIIIADGKQAWGSRC